MFFAPTVARSFQSPRGLDRSLERFVGQAFTSATRGLQFEQDETSWTLSLDLPGLTRDALDIGIEGAVVRIESKAEAQRQVKLAYELPLDIDGAASEARLENGVLTLKLAKALPINNSFRLEVK